MEERETFFQSARSKAVFVLLLVVFYLAGGIGLRWLYEYRQTLIGAWLYPALLVIFVMVTVALVVIGGGIWIKSRNSPLTASDDSEAKLQATEENGEEKPLQKEKTRLQKVSAEIWERIKIEGPIFAILLLIFHFLAWLWFRSEFMHFASMSAYWVAIVAITAALLLRKLFQEFPGLKILGALVLFVVAAAFVKQGIGEYKKAKGNEKNPRGISKDVGIYPLPDQMPDDTSFMVTAKKGVWTPKIISPEGYTTIWTRQDYTHCYDIRTELGEVEFCPNYPKVNLPPGNNVQFKARMDSTRIKVQIKRMEPQISRNYPVVPPVSDPDSGVFVSQGSY